MKSWIICFMSATLLVTYSGAQETPADSEFSGVYQCSEHYSPRSRTKISIRLNAETRDMSFYRDFGNFRPPLLSQGYAVRSSTNDARIATLEYTLANWNPLDGSPPVRFTITYFHELNEASFRMFVPDFGSNWFDCVPTDGSAYQWSITERIRHKINRETNERTGHLAGAVANAVVAGIVRRALPIEGTEKPYHLFEVEFGDRLIGQALKVERFFVALPMREENRRPDIEGKLIFLSQWPGTDSRMFRLFVGSPLPVYVLEKNWILNPELQTVVEEYVSVKRNNAGKVAWAEKYRESRNPYLAHSARVLLKAWAELQAKKKAEETAAQAENIKKAKTEREAAENALNRKKLAANSLSTVRAGTQPDGAVNQHIRFLGSLKTPEALALLKEVSLDKSRSDVVRSEAVATMAKMGEDGSAIIKQWAKGKGGADYKLKQWSSKVLP